MSEYWTPIETGSPVMGGCLNCGPRPGLLRWKDNPHPGFGHVSLYCDGKGVDGIIHSEGATGKIQQWRRAANADPAHQWVIEVDGPLRGIRYTRQQNGRWLATHRSMGFA